MTITGCIPNKKSDMKPKARLKKQNSIAVHGIELYTHGQIHNESLQISLNDCIVSIRILYS